MWLWLILYSRFWKNAVVEYTVAGQCTNRSGNADPVSLPLIRLWLDGMIVMGVGTNAMWAKLCNLDEQARNR